MTFERGGRGTVVPAELTRAPAVTQYQLKINCCTTNTSDFVSV